MSRLIAILQGWDISPEEIRTHIAQADGTSGYVVAFAKKLVLEARVFTLILIGFVVVMDVGQMLWAMLGGHLVAMVLAYLMAGGRAEDLKRLWGSLRAKRVRRRYQVLEGGRGHRKPPYLN